MTFKEYKGLDLVAAGNEILEKWKKEDAFRKSLEIREGAPEFIFFEGPPSANGMPGIHHVMARSIKDSICRYKTQSGYKVNRRAGWDTHGLPVELGVEKKLGITKEDIGRKISVEEYNEACRTEVMKYTKEWVSLTERIGYWVDMDDPYITYDNRYIETLWYLLKKIYDKGLLYKGFTIQPYSPAAGTGLSSHELNQPGCYRDVKDTTVAAQFELIKDEKSQKLFGCETLPVFFLAWTTTPWTLPSNTALCVGPNIDYVRVVSTNPYSGEEAIYVLAKSLVPVWFNGKQPFRLLEGEFKGSELTGISYHQLIPWFTPEGGSAFKVIPGDYVTTEDGTGIVHIAPTFGADDARVAKAAGVPGIWVRDLNGELSAQVDRRGRFFLPEEMDAEYRRNCVNEELYGEYAGRYVKNAYDPSLPADAPTLDVDLCVMLKQQGKAFRVEKHVHNYPHCWRTDKPILYYPLDSWFIRSTACRDRMVELNKSIKWKPEHTGTGRFGKWLENLNDWNLSRSRYWGTPLPIWRNADTHEEICIGSVEELYNEMEKAVAAGVMAENPWKKAGFVVGDYSDENYNKIDLHRPYVDDIVLVSESGKPMKRELDLIDVWFDSGAMPYAQLHYPFENKDLIDNRSFYPADFIAEGQDQTRGWFFTLHAIATMVFDSVAYKSVISNGLVLDKNGNKMSKRLGNAVDPFMAIEKYGTDPIRWYMISNSSPWDNLKFDEAGVEEVSGSKFFGKLHNTYSFFALYANLCDFDFAAPQVPLAERPEIDRWIISVLNSLVKEVTDDIEDYELTKAARAISDFVVNNLSNWYVRLNRSRFWDGDLAANQTLYQSLKTVAMLMAPIAPFYADMLYRDLTGSDTSVHLAAYPKADEAAIDSKLEKRMAIAQQITSMVLSLRRKKNLKVKQPLTAIMIPVLDEAQKQDIEAVADLIMSEVNVKGINYVGGDAGILVKRIKPDFKKLGPKFGKNMKAAAQALTSLEQSQIAQFEKDGKIALTLNGEEAVVELADVEVISEDIPGWLVANDGNITVALDITITDDLRKEGIARELVNRIQNVRKSKDFNITDRIVVKITPDEHVNDAVAQFKDYIAKQVLAVAIELAPVEGTDVIALDMDDYELKITVDKA